MGAVYRARDTQLGRDVALKVLLPEVSDNPDRLARFQREGHVLAALNHPHIAAIYGFEHHDGVSALVIELGVPKEMNGSAVDAKRQISTGGAAEPIWRADGKEIVYMTVDGTLMSVPVEASDGVLRTGTPRALFRIDDTATFDLTADGERFLVNRAVSESDPPVTVIVNWTKLLVQ